MNKRELEDAIRDEVAEWPGVSVDFENATGTGHPKAKLMFGDLVMRRPYASTPSDSYNGLHRCLGDMRRVMKQLGAERTKPEPSKEDTEKRYAKAPPPGPTLAELVEGEKASPKVDVADQLEATGIASPEQATKARKAKAPMIAIAPDDADEDDGAAHEAEAARLAAAQESADAIVDGIYFGLPAEIYHKVRRISTSGLQRIDVSPADFWKDSWLDPNPTVLTPEQEKKQNEARRIGSAYHVAQLEPELFDALYVRELDRKDYPAAGFIGTDTKVKAALKALGQQQTVSGESTLERAERLAEAGHQGVILAIEQAAWAETVKGRMPLSAKVFDEIKIDMERIHTSGSIGEKLTGGAAEVSIFWTDRFGLPMKARVDYLRADFWVDFKTFANPRRKPVKQVIADAFRYDRYHMQAFVYRDAIENVRLHGLQIVGDASDAERALIAAIQMAPGELSCWYIFQQKGGVPNLLSREVKFWTIPLSTRRHDAIGDDEGIERQHAATSKRTQLHIRAENDVNRAKEQFMLHSQVYEPGQPWRPIDAEGTFDDIDFNQYWLEGTN